MNLFLTNKIKEKDSTHFLFIIKNLRGKNFIIKYLTKKKVKKKKHQKKPIKP